ncbi:glycosyltransferase family 39 protein [Spirochaeta africana]|uniref:Uncharacterized protein n=1 Tax=Spirochaeta africana (strain ATCC 700263 / DSM 8902 / Z-7692) TaxID=889378 RepID=H9UF63_SPIAZ|nr:glycosyltransferase family 39 protein [Spirochaeta africana]AFG36156.1 hypothetical protein Spiaf_0047 [Spirochaeta africana DSM 8902]
MKNSDSVAQRRWPVWAGVLVALCVVGLLALADAGLAMYGSRDGSTTMHAGHPVVLPVRVTLPEADAEVLGFAELERVSPRGNVTGYGFAGDTAYVGAHFFADMRIAVPPELQDRVGPVEVWFGGEVVRSDNPDDLPDLLLQQGRMSVLPPLRGVANYRGDLLVGLLALLRAAALVLGFWWGLGNIRPAGPAAARVVVAWAALAVMGLVLSPLWQQVLPVLVSDLAVLLARLAAGGFTGALVVCARDAARQPAAMSGTPAPGTGYPAARWQLYVAIGSIALLGLVLRIWNPAYLQGLDTFNLTAARALNDTGSFAYERNRWLTWLLAGSMRLLGDSLLAARLPLALLSLCGLAAIGSLARPFGRAALGSTAVLWALSPVAIEKAVSIREYELNMVLAALVMTLLLHLYLRERTRPVRCALLLTAALAAAALLIIPLGIWWRIYTLNSVLQVSGFLYAGFLLLLAWQNMPRWRRAIVAAAAVGVIGLLGVAPRIGPFSSRLYLSVNFIRFYFDPLSSVPMHWFSFRAVGMLLPVLLSLAALWNPRNRDVAWAMTLALWGSLIFFSLQMGGTDRSRYLYHAFPLYVVLMGVGVRTVVQWVWISGRSRQLLLGLALVLTFYLPNTAIAARHSVPAGQERQVTSLGHANYFYSVHEKLLALGLTETTPLVLRVQRPDIMSYLTGRPVTGSYVIENGTPYDIARSVYFESRSFGVHQLEEALHTYESGFYVTRELEDGYGDLHRFDTILSYHSIVAGHAIYSWGVFDK